MSIHERGDKHILSQSNYTIWFKHLRKEIHLVSYKIQLRKLKHRTLTPLKHQKHIIISQENINTPKHQDFDSMRQTFQILHKRTPGKVKSSRH